MLYLQDRERLEQNLKDAGCSQKDIDTFFQTMENGQQEEALAILAEHREQLLETFHKSQYCMDCLDYLVYKLNAKD